ncbi:hypothetical protein GGI07_004995 [Coemansia sp. Benny D115]|nr:hypothetical protein GGI07_004995 [Coemansia sp. Benny D115]
MLHVCSNIPRLSADSVRTVVLILSGQLSENGAELGLLESGVWNKQWPTAKCLYVQNDITLRNGLRTEALGAHERAMQVVMNHVPNLDSFYLTRNRPDYEIADLTFGSAIAGNSPKLKRLEVYCDIRCSRVPFGLPKLTSLVMTIRPGCTVSWWIPCAASGTLQNMDLSNVETDLFLQMYRQNNGTVSFVNLKTLRLRQRTNLVMADNPARMRERQRAAVQEEAVVEFPQLQVARILGIQEHVPIGVFPALVRSAVKRLDINLGVRSGMQLRLGEMRHLKHLCASLPLISDVQSVVNDVLTSPMATLLTLHLRTNVLLECRIPTSFHMANLRILNLESFIPFEHVRLIIKFLPRLVFLKAGIVKDPEAESILTFAETEMIALAAYEPLETSLQVLKLWHCESLWAPGGFTSLRVAMIIGLLVSIPSLEQFSAPVDVPAEAVIDDRAYGKVYDAFAKFPDA